MLWVSVMAALATDPFVWGEEEEEEEEGETNTGASDALRCLEWLCGFTVSHDLLVGLLKERNIEGYTPFMAATAYKVCPSPLGCILSALHHRYRPTELP